VEGKIFAGFGEDQGRLGIGFKATLPEQAILIQDPRFAVASYVGRHGWTTLSVEGRLDWVRIESLIRRSYAHIAPKRLREASGGRSPRKAAPSRPRRRKTGLRRSKA
jgi:predicted DNA-binding protein (MmcQ/YjbR family)